MGAPIFIAGDWGSTRLRLSLCRGGELLERREGEGIIRLGAAPEAHLLALTAEWRERHGALPVFLCGMVGSRNGWREAGYLPCPADPGDLARAAAEIAAGPHRVLIAPGLSCVNPLGAPDVMRGEETQIAGALALLPPGDRLLILPGTHGKWAWIEDGRVARFLTAPVGEIFALLRDGSTLGRAGDGAAPPRAEPFLEGVRRQRALDPAALLATLFECRTRQLLEGWRRDDALAYLSGLLIGADVAGGLGLARDDRPIALVGSPGLTGLYARALSVHGREAAVLDGDSCALAGLRAIFLSDQARSP